VRLRRKRVPSRAVSTLWVCSPRLGHVLGVCGRYPLATVAMRDVSGMSLCREERDSAVMLHHGGFARRPPAPQGWILAHPSRGWPPLYQSAAVEAVSSGHIHDSILQARSLPEAQAHAVTVCSRITC